MLAALDLCDLEDVAARCTQLRTDLGLSADLWTADRLADVLAAAVLDAGWPAAAAVPALLAVAADPATRSPARLSRPGPWWDAPARPAGGDRNPDGQNAQNCEQVAGLEAVLAETGGRRVALQRQARAELAAERIALNRSSVTLRAVEIMRRADMPRATVVQRGVVDCALLTRPGGSLPKASTRSPSTERQEAVEPIRVGPDHPPAQTPTSPSGEGSRGHCKCDADG